MTRVKRFSRRDVLLKITIRKGMIEKITGSPVVGTGPSNV